MAKLLGEQQQRITAKLDRATDGPPNPLIDRLRDMQSEGVSFHQTKALRLEQVTNNGYFEPGKLASLSSTDRKYFQDQVDAVMTIIGELSSLDEEAQISSVLLKQELNSVSSVDVEERTAAVFAILDKFQSLESEHRSKVMAFLDRIEAQDRVIRTFLEERSALSPKVDERLKTRYWSKFVQLIVM